MSLSKYFNRNEWMASSVSVTWKRLQCETSFCEIMSLYGAECLTLLFGFQSVPSPSTAKQLFPVVLLFISWTFGAFDSSSQKTFLLPVFFSCHVVHLRHCKARQPSLFCYVLQWRAFSLLAHHVWPIKPAQSTKPALHCSDWGRFNQHWAVLEAAVREGVYHTSSKRDLSS